MSKIYNFSKLIIKGSIIFSLLVSSFALNAQVYGPNLVLNPGFEDVSTAPMTDWTLSTNTAVETTYIISGTKSMRFSNVNTGNWGSAYQVITVEPGATYKFGYSGFVLDAYGPAGGTLTAPRAVNGEVRSGNLATGTVLLTLQIASSTITTVSGEFTIPVGVTQVFVRAIKSFGICTVDDVILQKKDATTTLPPFVDQATTAGTLPVNSNIGSAWELNFSDEFNGTAVDATKWNIDNSTTTRAARPGIGINSWFWKPANVAVASGNLILKVTKETSSSMNCGSINSSGKYLTTYGYFEARIKIADATKGTHTAYWLQGPNQGTVDGTGNDGAEIDIFESAWTADYTKSVIHIDGYAADHQANTIQYTTTGIHNGTFHTWGMWWTSSFIKIYYDGVLKVTYNVYKWIPQVDQFLWLSDGASFGFPDGDPCFTSQPLGFLTEAYVDYIRVWKPQQVVTEVIAQNASDIEIKTKNDKLLINASSLISSVSVYDTLGKVMAQISPKNSSASIDMNAKGIYIVETKLENGEFSRKKFLIQ